MKAAGSRCIMFKWFRKYCIYCLKYLLSYSFSKCHKNISLTIFGDDFEIYLLDFIVQSLYSKVFVSLIFILFIEVLFPVVSRNSKFDMRLHQHTIILQS